MYEFVFPVQFILENTHLIVFYFKKNPNSSRKSTNGYIF